MGHISEHQAKNRIHEAPWPLKSFRRGFLTFARFHDLQNYFGLHFPITRTAEQLVTGFLDDGWSELDIEWLNARKHFTDLSRQAYESLFAQRGLQSYALSGTQAAWWASPGCRTNVEDRLPLVRHRRASPNLGCYPPNYSCTWGGG